MKTKTSLKPAVTKDTRGFTIVELILALSILGTLAAAIQRLF